MHGHLIAIKCQKTLYSVHTLKAYSFDLRENRKANSCCFALQTE